MPMYCISCPRGCYVKTADSLADALRSDPYWQDADLSTADLSGQEFFGIDFRRANFSGANIDGTKFQSCKLSGAVFTPRSMAKIRDDFFAVLSHAPREVQALIDALDSGRVNGSAYRDDSGCGCLVGTLAIARGGAVLCPDARRVGELRGDTSRLSERFFFGIQRGDTPASNPLAKIARDWAADWLSRMKSAFTPAPAPLTVQVNGKRHEPVAEPAPSFARLGYYTWRSAGCLN